MQLRGHKNNLMWLLITSGPFLLSSLLRVTSGSRHSFVPLRTHQAVESVIREEVQAQCCVRLASPESLFMGEGCPRSFVERGGVRP